MSSRREISLVESGVSDEDVSLVRLRMDSVDDNVLKRRQKEGNEGQLGSKRVSTSSNDETHIVLLMNMTLRVPIQHHLRMKMVQHPLDSSNPSIHTLSSNGVQPRVGNEIEQLRVEVVESFVGSDGGEGEGSESSGGESVLG